MKKHFLFCLMLVLLTGCDTANTVTPPVQVAPASQSTNESLEPADVTLVVLDTTLGKIEIEVHPEWAPVGARHFLKLVKSGFYDNCKFFRVVPNFMVQFGIPADPQGFSDLRNINLQDDPKFRSNIEGYVTFAQTSAPNSRSTQIFINYGNNSFLDEQRFVPFGIVKTGMDIAHKINSEYGESPDQSRIQQEGNTYLDSNFPKLDGIIKASIKSDTDASDKNSATKTDQPETSTPDAENSADKTKPVAE